MKFICNGIDFSSALTTVVKACSTKTTNSILECIQLTAKNDSITLLASDEELTIERTFTAEVLKEGKICVHGRTITEFIKKLEEETLTVATEQGSLTISYADAKTSLQYLESENFPKMEFELEENKFCIDAGLLKEFILKTIPFCAQDDARPVLRGCLLEGRENTFTMVALDGYRMAKVNRANVAIEKDFKLICPARTLAEMAKLLVDGEQVELYFQKNRIKLLVKDTVLMGRLIENEFVNIAGIIPTQFATKVVVDRKLLQKSVDRASIFVKNERNNIITFDLKDGYLTVSCKSEIANCNDPIKVDFEGVDLKITMNCKYIMDALNALSMDTIILKLNSSTSPFVLTGTENDDYLYLILPIRVNNA